ncbi:hypothetical protein [Lysinibacillus sp. 54212]|uniref:hypothetical protein n=1 Tax=Lysinibacillus sp. 54212 TaxID=3119829 RepID=UPI002FC7BB76
MALVHMKKAVGEQAFKGDRYAETIIFQQAQAALLGYLIQPIYEIIPLVRHVNFTIIIRHFISYYNLHGVVMGLLLNMGFASHKSIYSVKTRGLLLRIV